MCLNSDWTPQACWSQWVSTGMSVSDGTCNCPMEFVGLRWVFNQACRSLMGMSVSDEACQGLQRSMSRSPMGL